MPKLSFFDVNCISVQTTCKKYQTCPWYIYFTSKRYLFKLLISFYEDPWMGMNLYLYKSTVHVPPNRAHPSYNAKNCDSNRCFSNKTSDSRVLIIFFLFVLWSRKLKTVLHLDNLLLLYLLQLNSDLYSLIKIS